jgi:hypothetical protein
MDSATSRPVSCGTKAKARAARVHTVIAALAITTQFRRCADVIHIGRL